MGAWEFVQPLLVQKDDQYLLVHLKQQWKEIKVGIKKNDIRFILTKFTSSGADYADYTVEGKFSFTYQTSPPPQFEVERIFEDETWKGVSLKLKNIITDDNEDEGFDMV
ncbi:MAG: hypothetical protein ACXV2C_01820 [Candidatus Bathyarchaeia archaeon]